VGKTAWRVNKENPSGCTPEGGEEELWIQRFGRGNYL